MRKNVRYWRSGAVTAFAPRVSDVAVLPGEICTMPASLRTGCTVCATDELNGPSTPISEGSCASVAAAAAPVAGSARSSWLCTARW